MNKISQNKNSILVIFDEDCAKEDTHCPQFLSKYETVIAPEGLRREVEALGSSWISLERFIDAGSVQEAGALAKELSRLEFPQGGRITKSFLYKGYELWWIHYNSIYLYYCLPYTQYKKLLEYIRVYKHIYLHEPKYKDLFLTYLHSYGCHVAGVTGHSLKNSPFLSFGLFIQLFVMVLSLPVLMVRRIPMIVFIGDKFDKLKDYDFRMRYIYKELRERGLAFIECIRSLESWNTVFKHASVRRRPVIYSEAVTLLARFMSFISWGWFVGMRRFGPQHFESEADPFMRFKFLVATKYLIRVYDDVWGIRIMASILRMIGIKAMFIPSALERNFHAVIGCKISDIPTIGIMHGASPRHYTVTDYLPGFDGEKMMSVDKYGMWSHGWKEYYERHSNAFMPEQLIVSGLMRPVKDSVSLKKEKDKTKPKSPIRILFISEQLSVPSEVLIYIEALLRTSPFEFDIIFRFRPYRDGFYNWLRNNRPDILYNARIRISEGTLPEAIENSDVVVGSHSTAVLEALIQYRIPVFFRTSKWGDYYDLKEEDRGRLFFAEDPDELIEKIRHASSVSADVVSGMRERFFGDPERSGGKWVVDELEKAVYQEK